MKATHLVHEYKIMSLHSEDDRGVMLAQQVLVEKLIVSATLRRVYLAHNNYCLQNYSKELNCLNSNLYINLEKRSKNRVDSHIRNL